MQHSSFFLGRRRVRWPGGGGKKVMHGNIRILLDSFHSRVVTPSTAGLFMAHRHLNFFFFRKDAKNDFARGVCLYPIESNLVLTKPTFISSD